MTSIGSTTSTTPTTPTTTSTDGTSTDGTSTDRTLDHRLPGIKGVVATGSGQQLMAPFNDFTISGLALRITSAGTGDFGNFTYSPGHAQRGQTAVSNATDLISGYLTSSENDFKARLKLVNDQVASMETRVTAYETRLPQQYAPLEGTISTLKSQSSFLTNQVNSMNKSGN